MRTAVTGGIAEGKSTVVAIMADLGLTIISADATARECLDRPEVAAEVAMALGLGLPLDRVHLRALVAEDHDARGELNRILHPLIRAELAKSAADIFEIPLLIESSLQGDFDRVIVVTCGPEEQLRRLTARVGDEKLAKRLISLQIPTSAKEKFADAIIDTRMAPEALRGEVKKKLAEIGVLHLAP